MYFDATSEIFGLADEAREEKQGNIIPLIHRWISEQEEKANDYRGSRLWSLCGFKGVLDGLFPESANEVRPNRLFLRNGVGTWTHKFLQNHVLAKSGIIFGDWKCHKCQSVVNDSYWPGDSGECRLSQEHDWDYQEMEVAWKGASPSGRDILGHVDGIMFPGGKRTLLDIKTTSAKTFNYYLQKPNEDHIYQLNVYMALDPGGATQAIVLYLNLENGDMKSFKFFKDLAVMEDAKRKLDGIRDWEAQIAKHKGDLFATLSKILNKGINVFQATLPARACVDPDSKRARFCPQKDQCWNVPLIEATVRKAGKQ